MGSMKPFFNLKKFKFKSFKKIHKKYLNGANCIHYLHAKLQYEIPCILLGKNDKNLDLGV
jgi:hypothetical protein